MKIIEVNTGNDTFDLSGIHHIGHRRAHKESFWIYKSIYTTIDKALVVISYKSDRTTQKKYTLWNIYQVPLKSNEIIELDEKICDELLNREIIHPHIDNIAIKSHTNSGYLNKCLKNRVPVIQIPKIISDDSVIDLKFAINDEKVLIAESFKNKLKQIIQEYESGEFNPKINAIILNMISINQINNFVVPASLDYLKVFSEMARSQGLVV